MPWLSGNNNAKVSDDKCKRAVSGIGEPDVIEEVNKIQNTMDLNDLNGPKFWKLWVKAGGDPDEYVKETMPNFGIVGALLLTITIPLSMEPVPFAYGDNSAPTVDSWAVTLYAIALNVSTATSMVQIIISVGLFQQYVNCYSKELRIGFAAKLGYVVCILTTMLIVDTFTLFVALFIVMFKTYNTITAVISTGVVLIGCLAALAFYTYIVVWNSNTYSAQMVLDLTSQGAAGAAAATAGAAGSGEGEGEGVEGAARALEACASGGGAKVSNAELAASARELQAALAKFAANVANSEAGRG